MRREERRTIRVVLIVGVVGLVGAAAFPFALYFFGLSLAPPRPVPAATGSPRVVLDALWARAEGGRASAVRPISPITVAEFIACMVAAPGENDNQRSAACGHVMPGMPGLEYLATLHIQDHGVGRNSFRGGHSQFATIVWMTRSWTKEEFLNTLAARARFGYGWRGVEAAAHGFFGRSAAELTLPQAALIASRVGDLGTDPWCEPQAAARLRHRVLERMRDNGAISSAEFRDAAAAALGLAPSPDGRATCDRAASPPIESRRATP